jgi:hypothetical protein
MNSSENIHAAPRAGRKIEAIKLMRTERGLDLKEAKEEVEKIEAQMRQAGRLPAKKSSGCGSSAVLLVMGFAAVAWLLDGVFHLASS